MVQKRMEIILVPTHCARHLIGFVRRGYATMKRDSVCRTRTQLLFAAAVFHSNQFGKHFLTLPKL